MVRHASTRAGWPIGVARWAYGKEWSICARLLKHAPYSHELLVFGLVHEWAWETAVGVTPVWAAVAAIVDLMIVFNWSFIPMCGRCLLLQWIGHTKTVCLRQALEDLGFALELGPIAFAHALLLSLDLGLRRSNEVATGISPRAS